MARRNPDWAGSPKQIEWAKRIRAEAAPVIQGWIADIQTADARNKQRRMAGSWSARRVSPHSFGADVARLRRALEIADARFWIDNRTCGNYHDLLRAVERFEGSMRSNPGTQGSLLGVGTLHELEVEVGGRTRKIKTPGKWLAWEPKARRFHICTLVRRQQGINGLDGRVIKAHRKFHGQPARSAAVVDVPAPTGKLEAVGLLRALVYRVPSKLVLSPEKNPYAWHHAFGDTGHKGGAEYPDRVKPQLCRDRAGHLFICRRKGNIFTVDTWLRG